MLSPPESQFDILSKLTMVSVKNETYAMNNQSVLHQFSYYFDRHTSPQIDNVTQLCTVNVKRMSNVLFFPRIWFIFVLNLSKISDECQVGNYHRCEELWLIKSKVYIERKLFVRQRCVCQKRFHFICNWVWQI